MLKTKLNLECARGHRWFAPNPGAFVGRACGAGLSGTNRPKSCEQPLTQIAGARPPV
jgi:hypothetical protein